MDIITAFTLDNEEIEDIIFSIKITLNQNNKHLLSTNQRVRLNQILEHLKEYSYSLKDDLESKKKNLTPRELEVFNLLIRGFSAQEIADHIHLSINTVKVHIKNIYRKLNVEDRVELIIKFG